MIYAIADIHGHLDQLERALRLVEADGGPDAPIVFLGDYVDRGPDSAGVLARLVEGQAQGRPWTCLMGNHDRMFTRFVRDGAGFDSRIQFRSGKAWTHRSIGGLATLASYGVAGLAQYTARLGDLVYADMTPDQQSDLTDLAVQAAAKIPPAHIDFLAALPTSHRAQGLIFAHAGIMPGVALADQQEDDLIWIREPFLSDPRDHGALVVHGHTALDRPEHCGNRVNLDGGAGYGRPLVPAVFDGGMCHVLNDRGRWPLRPAVG